MAKTVSPALRALLEGIIDYAGMYPPASLPRDAAAANFLSYRDSPHAWMLRWLVIGEKESAGLPAELNGALSILGDGADPRAAARETKSILNATPPTYCEVPLSELPKVKAAKCFAKIRTGSVKPEGIPPVGEVAAFILRCAELKLPFKATAGLHHAVRAEHVLTYESNAPRAVMHGFLNVFLAAALAWHGERNLEPILSEMDAGQFRFDDRACWRDRSLTVEQVKSARRDFAHSFGSCSFTEP